MTLLPGTVHISRNLAVDLADVDLRVEGLRHVARDSIRRILGF